MKTLLSTICLLGAVAQANAMDIYYPFTDASFGDGTVDTLEEMDLWLQQHYSSGDVTVYIAPGTYQDATSWNFGAGNNQLTITAEDQDDPPLFDGCLSGSCISGAGNGYFLRIEPQYSATPDLNRVALQHIKVRNYVNGVYVWRTDNADISHNQFDNIGSAFNQNIVLKTDGSRRYNGYAAIHANQVNNLLVESNTVSQAYNDDRPLLMHAVYLVSSHDVSVSYNQIDMISGDPIRIRNASDDISLNYNVINDSGQAAISTFEDAGNECPSGLISASFNQFGMVFPYQAIYSQSGFETGWANKSYLHEGLSHNRGFKITVDPQLSPASCLYHNITSKADVFDSQHNAIQATANDPRILAASTDVDLAGGGQYVRILSGGELVLDTNQHFIGCSSSTEDTCDNNGTSTVNDDSDWLNADDPSVEYNLILHVKSGSVDKNMQLSGAGLLNYGFVIPANLNGDWFDYVLPQRISFADRSEALLTFKAINSGPFVQSIRFEQYQP